MTCTVTEAIINGDQRDDFIDATKKYGGCTRMSGTAVDLVHALFPITVSRIIASVMDRI